MGAESHRQLAGQTSVGAAVLTVSDTRTETTDTSGQAICDLLLAAGHCVAARAIVPDDPGALTAQIQEWTGLDSVQAMIVNGGTGVSRRDRTYETLAGLYERRLDGFGELFRMLSFGEIGAAAMLSRASAGVYRHRIVFSLPGSTKAVRLGMEKLILPELNHLVWELNR